MKIIGFNFDKIEAERKEMKKGKKEVNSNINIKDIKEEKIDMFQGKKSFKIEFEFTVDYKPEIAKISLHGHLLTLLEEKESKEIKKSWKKKKISDNLRIPIFNFILKKCNLKALQFEEEFGLPPHIPLPTVKSNDQNKQSYTG